MHERRDGTEHGSVGEHVRGRAEERNGEDVGDGERVEERRDRDRCDEAAFDDVAADDEAASAGAIGDRPGDESEQEIRDEP